MKPSRSCGCRPCRRSASVPVRKQQQTTNDFSHDKRRLVDPSVAVSD